MRIKLWVFELEIDWRLVPIVTFWVSVCTAIISVCVVVIATS